LLSDEQRAECQNHEYDKTLAPQPPRPSELAGRKMGSKEIMHPEATFFKVPKLTQHGDMPSGFFSLRMDLDC